MRCSSELLGSLRHAQLRLAGAPQLDQSLASEIRLATGNYWHNRFNELFIQNGLTVMHEIKLEWLPEGWGGMADWLIWLAPKRAFELWDLKTVKAEGLPYIERSGAKDDHIWQVSAYWHALRVGGFPLVKTAKVLYLPITDSAHWQEAADPIVSEVYPLDKKLVWTTMETKYALTKAYLESGPWPVKNLAGYHEDVYGSRESWMEQFLTPELAEPMARVQKLMRNKDKWELKLVPHWSTNFCPFPDELCDCNTQGVTKIGEWVDGTYTARRNYEHIEAELRPQ